MKERSQSKASGKLIQDEATTMMRTIDVASGRGDQGHRLDPLDLLLGSDALALQVLHLVLRRTRAALAQEKGESLTERVRQVSIVGHGGSDCTATLLTEGCAPSLLVQSLCAWSYDHVRD